MQITFYYSKTFQPKIVRKNKDVESGYRISAELSQWMRNVCSVKYERFV